MRQTREESDSTRGESVGLNPLAGRLLAIQGVLIAGCVVAYVALGLSVTWTQNAIVGSLGIGGLLLFWLNHYRWPGTPLERQIAEASFIFAFLLVLVTTVFLAEYAAVALRFPYSDPWLTKADALMGVSVPALAVWTAAHPAIARLLALSYATFAPQLLLTLLLLAVLRERDRLWEYAFHFHFCLLISLVGFALWPAICAPEYLQFQSTLDVSRVVEQIRGFHDGTMTTIAFDDVEGLISFPSFHVAGAMIVSWAFRDYRWLFFPLSALNIVLVASTVMLGLHYVVDIFGGVAVFGLSLAAYRWWGEPLYRKP